MFALFLEWLCGQVVKVAEKQCENDA